MSTLVTPGPLHFRGALRLGLDWRKTPFKNYAGLRFYDSSATFPQLEVHRRSEYVHRMRMARWEIHNHANTNFRKDIVDLLTPLNAKHNIIRELVDKHRIEIHQIIHDKTCVLLVLRNWVNPLHDVEITRIVKALEKYSRRIRDKYEHIWKYVVAPSFEKGQTRLARYRGIQLYPCLPYILPKSLTTWLTETCKVDYSHAYPNQEHWASGLTELFRATLARLLGLHACTPTPALAQKLSTPESGLGKTHTQCIDPIISQAPPDALTPLVFDRGPPSTCACTPPPPSTMKKEENGAASAPFPLSSPFPVSAPNVPHPSNPFFPLIPDTSHKSILPLTTQPPTNPPHSTNERLRRISILAMHALEHGITGEKHLVHHAMQTWGVQKRTAREYAQLALSKLRNLDQEAKPR